MNPIVAGFIVGMGAFWGFIAAAWLWPVKQAPRQADPAKIARLERELGMEPPRPPREGEVRWEDGKPLVWIGGEWTPAEGRPPRGGTFTETGDIRPDEAPTRVVKLPADRTTEDCPRPEGCVMSHPCRKCGADRYQACVGDPYIETTMRRAPFEQPTMAIGSYSRKFRGIT